jgi:predicted P-loop ATPase
MMAACLIGAVARAFDHGCQMDYLTCLKGKQGIKKSTFWRTLGGEYFSDTMQKDIKDLRLCMNTCWLYEWAELEIWTSRSQQGTLKGLITQRVDDFRPPYGSGMGRYPRKSILVGSVNEDSFLRDKTGARRYWIIEVDQMIDIDLVIAERDSIWKAAVQSYRKGRLPMLSDHQEQQSLLNNQLYENEDPFLEPIQRRIEGKTKKFSTREILIETELREAKNITTADMNTAARILKSLGCVRDKHQTKNSETGIRSRLWSSPQADSPS